MDYSTPGLPGPHHLLECAQVHVYWISDAIQPSHPLSHSPSAFSLSQHQGLFQESVLCIRWPKYWSFSLSISPSSEFQDWFPLKLTGWISMKSKGLKILSQHHSLKASIFVVLVVYWPWIQRSCWIHLFTCKNRFPDKFQNAETIKYWQGDGATEKLIHCLWKCKIYSLFGRQFGSSL